MSRQVVVYSTPLCAPCERLKGWLNRRGVPFMVRDLMLDQEAAERVEAAGVMSAPALEVDGRILSGPALATDKLEALFPAS
ncbi:MAG: glutaredoxin family protein [Alphaproteobacteria bacterium]|nr:glutaredoxin family protein [Alphaproteobacteria bacterium]